LYARYGSSGDLTDLDEALRVLADATGRNPAPNDRAMIDTARGLILNARYDAQGEPTDLGAAMAAFEDALELGPSPSDRAWVLSTFGLTLQKRHTRTTRIDDLDRACALLRDAVAATGQGSPDWAIRANNLAVALEQRYHLFRRQQDLDEAIARVETAKERLGRSAPDLPAVLTTLGALLAARHNSQAARPDDAVRAQAALRRAVDLTPRGSTHRPRRLSTLGGILITWYRSTGEPRFLDSATRTFREAVDEAPEGAPERAAYLRNLAESYRMTYERTRDPADLDTTLAAMRRCLAVALDVDVESAFATGRTWGDWAAGRGAWPEALEAFGIAVDAAERAFRAQLLRREKETWLRQGGNLGGRAAQAAARTGDAVAAVVYLERGRALLLSEVLELARAEVGMLSSGSDAALARAFERAAQRWLELSRGADRGAPSLPVIGA
jgi:tetratricopeptide (TPR) repeat protein